MRSPLLKARILTRTRGRAAAPAMIGFLIHRDSTGEYATPVAIQLLPSAFAAWPARAVVHFLADLLTRQHGMPAIAACMLCSGDLRISEIVDCPNWPVSFYFPRIVFEWQVNAVRPP